MDAHPKSEDKNSDGEVDSVANGVTAAYDRKYSDSIARRCMENFVEEMKTFGREGGFQNCTADERRALCDIMTKRYLVDSLGPLLDTPLVLKVRQIIDNFINGKCRSLESFILEQIKDEPHETGLLWTCAVCGKKNQETKKKVSQCKVCGRKKDCYISKKLKRLNECRVDVTPHLTNATKDELKKAMSFEHQQKRWIGEEGKEAMFLSKQIDYELLERAKVKSEIMSVLANIHESLDCSAKCDNDKVKQSNSSESI